MMNVISNEFNCLCCKLLHCLTQKIDFLITEHMFRKYDWNIFNITYQCEFMVPVKIVAHSTPYTQT